MLKKAAGFAILAFVFCLPLQADHRHYRSHRRGSAFIEVYVGPPLVHGVYVRGFRSYGPDYGRYDYDRAYKKFRKFKHKRGHYKKHRYDRHYRGRGRW